MHHYGHSEGCEGPRDLPNLPPLAGNRSASGAPHLLDQIEAWLAPSRITSPLYPSPAHSPLLWGHNLAQAEAPLSLAESNGLMNLVGSSERSGPRHSDLVEPHGTLQIPLTAPRPDAFSFNTGRDDVLEVSHEELSSFLEELPSEHLELFGLSQLSSSSLSSSAREPSQEAEGGIDDGNADRLHASTSESALSAGSPRPPSGQCPSAPTELNFKLSCALAAEDVCRVALPMHGPLSKCGAPRAPRKRARKAREHSPNKAARREPHPSPVLPLPRTGCRCRARGPCSGFAEEGYNGFCSMCYPRSCGCLCACNCDCSHSSTPPQMPSPWPSPSPLLLPGPVHLSSSGGSARLSLEQLPQKSGEAFSRPGASSALFPLVAQASPVLSSRERSASQAAVTIEIIQDFSVHAEKVELISDDYTYVAEAEGKGLGLFSACALDGPGCLVAAMLDPRRVNLGAWPLRRLNLNVPYDALVCAAQSQLGFHDAAFPRVPRSAEDDMSNWLARHAVPKWYRINYSARPNVRILLAGARRSAHEQSVYWETLRPIAAHEELTCDMYADVPHDWKPAPSHRAPPRVDGPAATLAPSVVHQRPGARLKYVRRYRRRKCIGWGHGRASDFESDSTAASSAGEEPQRYAALSGPPLALAAGGEDLLGASDSRAGTPPAPPGHR